MTTGRFELIMGGEAIKDNETCLVWERSPGRERTLWKGALIDCFTKKVGGRKGWRLPKIEELASIIDDTQSQPTIPPELSALINNEMRTFYWSSTTALSTTGKEGIDPHYAWGVAFWNGRVEQAETTGPNDQPTWCVRGGQGHDAY